MTYTEMLSLNSGIKTTKEHIIQVIGNRWPLSAKEIHHSLSREYGVQVSYQAVHKSIQELEETETIIKELGKYKLSTEWIEKSENYFKGLAMTYKKNNGFNNENALKFDNYTDFPLFLGNIFNKPIATEDEETHVFGISRHLYWPLKFNFKDFELCKVVGKNAKPHIITNANTPFDRQIKKYYKIAKWPDAVIGANVRVYEDVIVQGNTLVQIKYSEKTKQKIDEIYESVNSLTVLFGFYMKRNFDKLEIEVTITRNDQIAKITRENIRNKIEEAK